MGLDEFSEQHSVEDIERFGKELLDKWGLEACEEAEKLDRTMLSEGTLTTYKAQVRNIISALGANPDVSAVGQYIQSSQYNQSTRSMMLSAIKKYYRVLDEHDKIDGVKDLRDDGITETDSVTKSGNLEDEEIENINELLPSGGDTISRMQYEDNGWMFTLEHKAIFHTLLRTNMSLDEMCKRHKNDCCLGVTDLDTANSRIKAYSLDNGNIDRVNIPTTDILESVLTSYFEYGPSTSFDISTRTAHARIEDINDAYKYFYGSFKNMEKLTPSRIRKTEFKESTQ